MRPPNLPAPAVRFAVFAACVLLVPAGLMAVGDPRLTDLGKLAMIGLPGPLGWALSRGVAPRAGRPAWRWTAIAVAVTLAVVGGAIAAAAALGDVRFQGGEAAFGNVSRAAVFSGLTSVLEEWGWAGGGLALSVAALGRRRGVLALGLLWSAWHLVPVWLRAGLFPDLETAPAPMIAAFVAACLAYRELLTRLRERARTWFAAAAGHAAPNILLAGLMAAGMSGFHGARWAVYPAPGGLVFLALCLVALVATRGPRVE